MIYVISDKELSVSINTFGAEVISAIYKGVERVWQNQNGNGRGTARCFFPFAGTARS